MSAPADGAGILREDVEFALDAVLRAACLQVSAGRGLVSLDDALAVEMAELRRLYPMLHTALRCHLASAEKPREDGER